ncbi:MAG TPA: aminoglycoside phosphotransferase family protein [Gemmatimonadales bacterium]|nr:aminoglycoside phosphotransferase family protein [Gemmatimonadales bacterium]
MPDPDFRARWRIESEEPLATTQLARLYAVTRADGTRAVLKIAVPHMEGLHEAEGLRFWDGDPTVRLLEHDPEHHAMVLELCEPGTTLRELPEPEQDLVIASLSRRLWDKTVRPLPGPYRPLAMMIEHWATETIKQYPCWTDPELTREGLRLFEELSRPSHEDVLLATDLHAGNVLRAQREPWLVIDPKPFIGDRAYDATQHLFNCRDRLRADPEGLIRRFAGLLEVDSLRVRTWLFARAAAEPRDDWGDDWMGLARVLVP